MISIVLTGFVHKICVQNLGGEILTEQRTRYFRTLGIDSPKAAAAANGDGGDGANQSTVEADCPNKSLLRALDRAYSLRSFEIEHYWKRATYFWGFQIAIFAAFGLIWDSKNDQNLWGPVTVALSILGILTALASVLSAKGSKFWQKNWEKHIDMLEDSIEGRLHKTVWLDDGRVSYSVSRVNQTLGWCFVVFWCFLTIFVFWKLLGLTDVCGSWLTVISATIIGFGGIAALFSQTTDLPGTFTDADGQRAKEAKKKFPCFCREIEGASREYFVRRYEPGEHKDS